MDGLSREQAFGLYADLEDAEYRPVLGKVGRTYAVKTQLGGSIGAARVAVLERVASGRGARVVLDAFGGGVRANFLPREEEEDAPSESNSE